VAAAPHTAPLLVNPAAKASPPKPARREMQVWDQQTLQAFLERAKGHRDYVGWLLLAATGMRRGEVLGLKWSDVDLQRGTLSVADSKTAAGRRLISLDTGTVAALREWRMQRMGTIHVLTETNGSPLQAQAFTERFRTRVRAWASQSFASTTSDIPTPLCFSRWASTRRSFRRGWGTPAFRSPSTFTRMSPRVCSKRLPARSGGFFGMRTSVQALCGVVTQWSRNL
jgi:integrase